MPPLRLTSLVQGALPNLSGTSRAVLSTLACRNGHAPPASEVATWVGLRDRFQLARVLRADGLPPLEQLSGWIRVLYWVLEAEAADVSLLELMQREHVDPATGYRLVRRVTGMRWSEVRHAGVSMILLKLRDRCTRRVAGARLRSAEQTSQLAVAVGDGITRRSDPQPATTVVVGHPAGVLGSRLLVSGAPFDVVVPRSGVAWVTRTHAAAVDYLQIDPGRILASVPTGPVPTSIAFAPSGNTAYVTAQFADAVAVIDPVRRVRTGTLPVSGNPLAVALSATGRTLYVTTNLDRLCAVELPHGRVVGIVSLPHAGHHLAMHPSGRWLYVPTWRAGLILELDARTLEATRTFSVGGVPQDVAVSADGLTLYAANEQGWLDAINLSTGRHGAPVPLGSGGLGLALSPDEAVLYVGLVFAGRVVVIDRMTLRVLGAIETGGKPRRIAFDPGGKAALIANEAGWVDVVR
ncbi:MAG TPA: YncE family protein [Gemmatimonadales bacterium]